MGERIAILSAMLDKSTGKIADGLLKHLQKQGIYAVFCYGRGRKKQENGYYKVGSQLEFLIHAFLARLTGFEGNYSRFATRRLISFLKKNKITAVYSIRIHGYYLNFKMLFDYMADKKIKFINVMVDETPFLGKCGYSDNCTNYLSGCGNCPQLKAYPKSWFFDRTKEMFKLKYESYHKLSHTIFVGPEYTVNAAKKSPLLEGIKTIIIDEAINLRTLYYPRNTEEMKSNLGISDDTIIIVCVAPTIYERKGTRYFLELAKRMQMDDRYVFVHVGYSDDKSLCPPNYIAIGYEANQDKLAEYYSLADLFVFPSLLDTMPNACLEALACGSPLLCFNVSGMPYIADETTATFVEPKNVEQMKEVVLKTKKKTQETINTCRKYAEKRYDSQDYFQRLFECCKEI